MHCPHTRLDSLTYSLLWFPPSRTHSPTHTLTPSLTRCLPPSLINSRSVTHSLLWFPLSLPHSPVSDVGEDVDDRVIGAGRLGQQDGGKGEVDRRLPTQETVQHRDHRVGQPRHQVPDAHETRDLRERQSMGVRKGGVDLLCSDASAAQRVYFLVQKR